MQARFDVRDALHEMAELNNVIQDTHGNVSQRDGDRFFIKPSGMEYKHIGASDVCEIMISGEQDVVNLAKPSVDTPHHKKIYELNPHVGAICHTHSPYATTYAALGRNLYCYTTEQADYFGGRVSCREYSDLNSWGNICVGHERAILLECHGVLTFGENAEEAVKLAAALEQIAQKNFLIESLAKSLGSSPSLLNIGLQSHEGEVKKWNDRYKEVYGQRNDTDSK